MKTQSTQMLSVLLAAKIATLYSAGLTPNQCMNIQEYEFNIDGRTGEATELEVWSNTKRTKGHKRYPVPQSVRGAFKPFLQESLAV